MDKQPKRPLGRPPGRTKAQAAITLDPELLELLRASPDGVSPEIQRRLKRSFDDEKLAPQLRELIEGVKAAAEAVDGNVGARWFESNYAIEVLAEAIKALVLAYKQDVRPLGGAVNDLFGEPTIVGQTLAREVLRKPEFRYLQEASERRSKAKSSLAKHLRKKGDDNDKTP